jgi:hypothetical protein
LAFYLRKAKTSTHILRKKLARIARKAVCVLDLISHRFSLDELPGAMVSFPTLKISKAVMVP